MKKLTILAVLVLALAVVPAAQATCVDFDSFCDGLELTKAGNILYGSWQNVDCAGTDLVAMGELHSGTASVVPDGLLALFGIAGEVVINAGAGTAEIWIYDGVNPATLVNTTTVTITGGTCPFKQAGGRSVLGGM